MFSGTNSVSDGVSKLMEGCEIGLLWTKEVEMVDSLDELKSSRSVSQILRCWMRGLRLL